MNDLLRVKGLGRLDGSYEFDLVELLSVDGGQALTAREQHEVRLIAGVRGGEIDDAVFSGDAGVTVALACILMRRDGKKVDDQILWDSRLVYSSGDVEPSLEAYERVVNFHIAKREAEEDEHGPPAEAPPESETNGGATSSSQSDDQESVHRATGLHALPTSATSDRETLAS